MPQSGYAVDEILKDFGLRINGAPFQDLCKQYEATGLLYPSKRDRLQAVWPSVQNTWERLLKGNPMLLACFHADDQDSGGWSSLTGWRATSRSWTWQHIASMGDPRLTWKVLMAAQRWQEHLLPEVMSTGQCWFQPSKGYAAQVYCGAAQHIGPSSSSIVHRVAIDYSHPPLTNSQMNSGLTFPEIESSLISDIATFVSASLGSIYAEAEELKDDPYLQNLDEHYRIANLSRRRRLSVCRDQISNEILGVGISYMGPLGINFSFLESRLDLIMASHLSDENRTVIAKELIYRSNRTTEDLRVYPILTDQRTASLLMGHGAALIRNYSRFTWKRSGLKAFSDFLRSIYSRFEIS